MSLLNLGPEEPIRKLENGRLTKILGIGGLIGAIALGSTFASDISLNDGKNVEFGQGMTTSVSCQSGPLTITPSQIFDNSTDKFLLSKLSLDGISGSSCDESYFKIAIYAASSSAPILNFSISKNEYGCWAMEEKIAGDVISTGGSCSYTGIFLTTLSNSGLDDSEENNIPADLVSSITVESYPTVPELSGEASSYIGQYQFGAIGPAGGRIFYVDEVGFTCGPTFTSVANPGGAVCHYLEVAPNTWSGGSSDPTAIWSNSGEAIAGIDLDGSPNNSRLTLGLGYRNSIRIVADDSSISIAAYLARSFSGGGKTDWYLPVTSELNLLCQWARGLTQNLGNTNCFDSGSLNSSIPANFYFNTSTGQSYFSSSLAGNLVPYHEAFNPPGYCGFGQCTWGYQTSEGFVRPIRAF